MEKHLKREVLAMKEASKSNLNIKTFWRALIDINKPKNKRCLLQRYDHLKEKGKKTDG